MQNVDPQRDLNDLFISLSPQLRKMLGRNLRAPEWVLEDACQTAWETFLAAERPVPMDHLLGWLATTARREALLIMARAEGEAFLADEVTTPRLRLVSSDPCRTAELRERLDSVRVLSPRQQRLVWMRGLGFSYTEMSCHVNASHRTIQRQLRTARIRLATMSSDDAA